MRTLVGAVVLMVAACRGGDAAAPVEPAPVEPAPVPVAQPPVDAASAAVACGGEQRGTCPPGESCRSCSQPARTIFFCASDCTSDADCKDPARPSCEDGAFCAAEGTAQSCRRKCAAPDTPVLTPDGERAMADLRAGDLVMTVDHGRVVARPLVRVARLEAPGHQVARVTLAGGAVLLMSHEHPTADGRVFADLAPMDRLGDAVVVAVESIPYPFDATHDILPASDSGAYFSAGALVGSTLR